ncbi:MAG TPA: glycosyltransferase family A protein [Xanthomonadales bacterium]|nr:glycosyltransferase family A protein [Xanthomonadales bacterium]
MIPILSVVITSDYRAGQERSWRDERAVLGALAAQFSDVPIEILLTIKEGEQVPESLANQPGVRLVPAPSSKSGAQKRAAAEAARSDLIGYIDSDCIPCEKWCLRLVDVFKAQPEFAVVTGRSFYPEHGLRNRMLALLDRGDVDPGAAGETGLLAANNFGIRRSVMLSLELPAYPPVFNSRIFARQLQRSAHRIWFDPGLACIHEMTGWAMEADIRRNVGHAVIAQRRVDDSIEYAWLARLGFASIPLMVVARTIHEWRICFRNAGNYGVSWFQMPVALALSVFLRFWEVPGMLDAVHGHPVQRTSYR